MTTYGSLIAQTRGITGIDAIRAMSHVVDLERSFGKSDIRVGPNMFSVPENRNVAGLIGHDGIEVDLDMIALAVVGRDPTVKIALTLTTWSEDENLEIREITITGGKRPIVENRIRKGLFDAEGIDQYQRPIAANIIPMRVAS